mmetsp:Transcript_77175/g.89804  ORF Transcript_77175/g.89804 Transcript_77175/m.89804 type:complete len:200 (+) Transcript_77175:561-1160(+)
MMYGFVISSFPMFVRFFSPPDTPLISPGTPRYVSRHFCRCSRVSVSSVRATASSCVSPSRTRHEKYSASAGVSLPITMSSCATNDTSFLYRSENTVSFRNTHPSSSCSASTAHRPMIALNSVDLPAPDGPITASTRPPRAVPLMLCSSVLRAGCPSSPVTCTWYDRFSHTKSTTPVSAISCSSLRCRWIGPSSSDALLP